MRYKTYLLTVLAKARPPLSRNVDWLASSVQTSTTNTAHTPKIFISQSPTRFSKAVSSACSLFIASNCACAHVTGAGRVGVPFFKMADGTVTVDKSLLAFLNGICRRQYFGDDDITDEFLRDDVLDGMAEEGSVLAT